MYLNLNVTLPVRGIAFCLVTFLAGCANNPLMQSSTASNSAPAEDISASLDDAVSAGVDQNETKLAPLPANVVDALMPGFTVELNEPQEERFDLVVDGLPAAEFFRGLVKGTRYNIVVSPGVSQTISLELNQVTIPEVLDIVADNYGLEFKQDGRLIRVMPGGIRTEIFQINYLNVIRDGGSATSVSSGQVTNSTSSNDSSSGSADTGSESSSVGTHITTTSKTDFWSQLIDTLKLIIGDGDGRTVVATPNAGIVVVRADPKELRSVKEYLQQAELILQRQVILEAKIMEVSLSEGFEQGIQWNNIAKFGSGVDADGNSEKYTSSSLSARDISTSAANEIVGGVFSAALTVKDFSTVIQLLGLQGNVQVLSSPRISTVNNQKAVIKVGSDEFFVTDIEIEDDSDSDSGNSTTDIELTPFFSGISLDVTPQISEDGTIILHVHPSISDVQDQSKAITLGDQTLTLPLAYSTIRETDSIISAKNGQIVVIGGLIQNINEEQQAQTPILSDIPWLGEAFKQKSQKSRKVELVILLRPIITNQATTREDIQQTRGRFKTMKEILNSPYERKFY